MTTAPPAPKAEVVAAPTLPGLEVTDIGAHTAGLTPADTITHLRHLKRVGAAWRWVMGDLVLSLIDGDVTRMHEALQQIAHLDLDERPSLMRSIAVAHLVPYERRVAALSWSHHVAVSHLDGAQQSMWLQRALDEQLTAPGLKAAITAVSSPAEQPPLTPPPPKAFTLPTPVLTRIATWAEHDDDAVIVLRREAGRITAEEVRL